MHRERKLSSWNASALSVQKAAVGSCSDRINTAGKGSSGAKVGYGHNHNLHFLTPFLKLSTQKIKNIDWGCLNLVKPSYFSYLIRLEIKRQLAKFQPSRVQTSKEEPKTSADLPPPVSSVDNTTTEIIS